MYHDSRADLLRTESIPFACDIVVQVVRRLFLQHENNTNWVQKEYQDMTMRYIRDNSLGRDTANATETTPEFREPYR